MFRCQAYFCNATYCRNTPGTNTGLQKKAGNLGLDVHVVNVTRESWGAGEPNASEITKLKPKKAINVLLNEKVPQARKCLEEKGLSEYSVLAKALCTDVRNTIERIVEQVLLADVVGRFRMDIQTKGKLGTIAKVSIRDCGLIDGWMTSYSKDKHLPPDEQPSSIFQPDRIESDLTEIKRWLEEFDNRKIETS